MEIILELIENFFILWFVLVCFKINVFADIGKIAVVTSIATFCAILIQQLQFVSMDESLNMLVNMIFGIILYAYLVKCFYWNEVRFLKAVGLVLIYFLSFILLMEQLFVFSFLPLINIDILSTESLTRLIISIPYRFVQSILILIIYWFGKEKINA